MIGRIVRLFIAIPALIVLYGVANSIGLVAEIENNTGYDLPAKFNMPGLNFVVEAREKAEEEARQAALKQLKKQVRKQYGPEVAAYVPEDLTRAQIADYATGGIQDLAAEAKKAAAADKKTSTQPKTQPPAAVSTTNAINGNKKMFNTARRQLATLPVKGRAPKTGYARDQFGSEWSDSAGAFSWTRNGCDTRNDVLARDLTKVTFKKGGKSCAVAAGVLPYERYTGNVNVKFVSGGAYGNQFDIEHLIALGNAWVTGAQQWPESKRAAFANDPINLFAADPSSNRQKGDGDAATWLPSNKPYRCAYVSHQVLVKTTYSLWVTAAEKAAIERVLAGCPA